MGNGDTRKRVHEDDDVGSSFGALDFIRIVGGLLLLNALLSYWFTSSSTWGYRLNKYGDARFWKYQMIGPELNLTLDELSIYNGTDRTLPIYVAVYGRLYDVSASRAIYGSKGRYHAFAGRDSARAFHNGCFGREDQLTYDLRGLDSELAMLDIRKWQEYYKNHAKYWEVGSVVLPEPSGTPPGECHGPKFPTSK